MSTQQHNDDEMYNGPKCPRCKKNRNIILYEHPISICLLCYFTVLENQDLDPLNENHWPLIRDRARKSLAGRRKKKAQREIEAYRAVQKMLGRPAPKIDPTARRSDDPVTCKSCNRQIPSGEKYHNLRLSIDEAVIECATCRTERERIENIPVPQVSAADILMVASGKCFRCLSKGQKLSKLDTPQGQIRVCPSCEEELKASPPSTEFP